MGNEDRQIYRETGIFNYEELVGLQNKTSPLMNDLVSFNTRLHILDSAEVEKISDDLHQSFMALLAVQKILDREIGTYRKKFANKTF